MSEASNLSKPTTGDLADVAFCLSQALCWLAKCYALGDVDLRAEYPDEAARRDAAVENGVATVSAHIDMTARTVRFVLNVDDGPDGATEVTMFSQGFIPSQEASH